MDAESEMFEAPGPVTVRVLRDGAVAHEERCESAEQALLVIEAWEDVDGTKFEVVDDLERRRAMPAEEYIATFGEPLLDDQRGD
jgi:hypothetical protein